MVLKSNIAEYPNFRVNDTGKKRYEHQQLDFKNVPDMVACWGLKGEKKPGNMVWRC